MKKFLLLYHSPKEAMEKMKDMTSEEKNAGMKPWLDWKQSMGDKLVDFGAPLASGPRILPEGNFSTIGDVVTGYTIIQAKDMDEAKDLLKDHPHLSWTDDCSIDLYEFMPMEH